MRTIVTGLAAAILLALAACSNHKDYNDKGGRNDLPQMKVALTDGSTLQLREEKGNLVLVFFLSDCEHCQREADAVSRHLSAFKNYDVYFLSNEEAAIQQAFAKKFSLTTSDNFHFARVEVSEIISNFSAIPTPSVYIYSHRKLIKKFSGETPIEKIIEAL